MTTTRRIAIGICALLSAALLSTPRPAAAASMICSGGTCVSDCGQAEDSCNSVPNCHAVGCVYDGGTSGCVLYQALCGSM